MSRRGLIPWVSIYKPRSRSGKQHAWLLHVSCAQIGVDYVRTASPDREASEALARDISRGIDRQRLGLISRGEARAAQYAAVPLLPELDDSGREVVGPPGGKPRPNHLDDYCARLRADRRCDRQVQMVRSSVIRLLRGCEAERIEDLDVNRIKLALAELSDEHELSDQTCRHYANRIKAFTRWLRKSARVLIDPIEDLPKPRVEELLHNRRALEEKELVALLKATAGGEAYTIGARTITAAERELLYTVALETGLRANELRQLTPESFDMERFVPLVKLKAGQTKNRKAAELPLKPETVSRIRAHLKGRAAGAPIFWVPDKPVQMFDVDRAAAGIARETLYGIADFHSLRHTFCTRLANTRDANGNLPSLRTCQELMRHSDVRLTARYMHATLHDQASAIAALPALHAAPARARARATGTDPANTDNAVLNGPFQRKVQRPTFPAVPDCSLLFPVQIDHKPRPDKEKEGKMQLLGFEGWMGQLQPTELRVAGSSPAGCVPQPPENPAPCEPVGEDPGAAPPPRSAPGAAPIPASPPPIDHFTAQELLAALQRKLAGGGQ